MGVNSLPKTVNRQRRGCDLNPGPSAPFGYRAILVYTAATFLNCCTRIIKHCGADDVMARAPAGCTVPGRHVTESQAFGVEFLASFFLVFVVFACYDKSSMTDVDSKVKVKVKEREHPFIIGLTYTGVLLFAVS